MIKKLGRKILNKVEESKAFWLKTDHYNVVDRVRSLPELAKKLSQAPTSAVIHHLREGKNDFAQWIEDVIGDKVLAKRLRGIKAKNWEEMKNKIVKEINKRIKQITK
ncbi:hypothetical protein DRN62_02160 [Nanoarchaeota archaeon]|nr:hypothetical protein [Nanoarchaeota archaeon]RLG17091.1 MAG: hypothetical protein DRN62_02160 [Nanoarchaeota archaeon]